MTRVVDGAGGGRSMVKVIGKRDGQSKELEMTRVKLAGVCLAALLAVGAVAAAGASAAAPEYGRCAKATKVGKEFTGRFSDSKCTKEVSEGERPKKGKFEWFPGAVKAHQTSTGGKGVLEEAGKYAVGCASESSVGEYSGSKNVKHVVVKFKKCEAPGLACTSEGHEKGELETVPLEGRLVWENEKAHKLAFMLYPEGGGDFIEFNCGGTLTVAVRGAILVPIKADKMSATVPLKYKGKKGIQQLSEYEEGGKKIKANLEADFAGSGWVPASQTITSTVTNEEKLEANAYI
jgi:hypothetical protein